MTVFETVHDLRRLLHETLPPLPMSLHESRNFNCAFVISNLFSSSRIDRHSAANRSISARNHAFSLCTTNTHERRFNGGTSSYAAGFHPKGFQVAPSHSSLAEKKQMTPMGLGSHQELKKKI